MIQGQFSYMPRTAFLAVYIEHALAHIIQPDRRFEHSGIGVLHFDLPIREREGYRFVDFVSVQMNRKALLIADQLEGVLKPKLGDGGAHGIACVDILLNL